MDYSQPYGTPPAPIVMPPGTRNYPRYVNGNPVTGVEGSIPPATAFDESQVEIVEVIQRAGLVPTHSDLTQLWQALEALFAQKYITTPITKTVHGVGADFPDLIAAFQWLGQYIITQTGYVTFMVAPGKWTYTDSIEINHANASRVAVQGGALLGATPQWQNFSISGYHNATDGTNHITYLRSVHATELSFASGQNGFVAFRSGLILRYLLLTGSQTVKPGGNPAIAEGNGITLQGGDIGLDGVSIWGFGSVGLRCNQNVAQMTSGLSFVCSYNNWQGVTLNGGMFIAYSSTCQCIFVSNTVSGLTNFAGLAWFGKFIIRGHGPPSGNAAVHCEQGGMIAVSGGSAGSGAPPANAWGAYIDTNQTGVIIAGAATIVMEASYYTNNATYGIWCYGQGTYWCDDSYFGGNGQGSIVAATYAFVEALRSTGVVGTCSPPVNTQSNVGAYIYF